MNRFHCLFAGPGKTNHRAALLVAMLVLLGWVSACSAGPDNRSQAVLEAGRLHVDLITLTMSAQEAAAGNFDALDELQSLRVRIQGRLDRLNHGDIQLGIPLPGESQGYTLDRVTRSWRELDYAIERIVARKDLLLNAADNASDFGGAITQLQIRLDEAARQLMEAGAPGAQQYLMMRNVLISERMMRSLNDILAGGMSAVSSADRLSRDSSILGQVLTGLKNGDADLNIVPIEDDRTQIILGECIELYGYLQSRVESLLTVSSEIFEIREAAVRIRFEIETMGSLVDELAQSY